MLKRIRGKNSSPGTYSKIIDISYPKAETDVKTELVGHIDNPTDSGTLLSKEVDYIEYKEITISKFSYEGITNEGGNFFPSLSYNQKKLIHFKDGNISSVLVNDSAENISYTIVESMSGVTLDENTGEIYIPAYFSFYPSLRNVATIKVIVFGTNSYSNSEIVKITQNSAYITSVSYRIQMEKYDLGTFDANTSGITIENITGITENHYNNGKTLRGEDTLFSWNVPIEPNQFSNKYDIRTGVIEWNGASVSWKLTLLPNSWVIIKKEYSVKPSYVYLGLLPATSTTATVNYTGITKNYYSGGNVNTIEESLNKVINFDKNTHTEYRVSRQGEFYWNSEKLTWGVTLEKAETVVIPIYYGVLTEHNGSFKDISGSEIINGLSKGLIKDAKDERYFQDIPLNENNCVLVLIPYGSELKTYNYISELDIEQTFNSSYGSNYYSNGSNGKYYSINGYTYTIYGMIINNKSCTMNIKIR